MRLLLDTHVLLWWLADDARLSKPARRLIADVDNVVFVSAASIWEIAIKAALGRLKIDPTLLQPAIEESGFLSLPVSADHAVSVFNLPPLHSDPFDRMLIAQARAEQLKLVSCDARLSEYGVDMVERSQI
ncbi:MAG: type II toxin-antitoxin system VapC family toxin [Pseudomonadota bacterium]